MSTSLFLMLLIMLFWLIIMLLCYAIVSLRLSISRQNSSRLIPPPSRSGKVETLAVGNRGSIYCVACIPVCGAVCCLNYADLRAVRVLSDCWASCTFALGFLIRLSGAAGGSKGGVTDTRLGVCRPESKFLTTIVILSDDLDRLYELCLSCLVS